MKSIKSSKYAKPTTRKPTPSLPTVAEMIQDRDGFGLMLQVGADEADELIKTFVKHMNRPKEEGGSNVMTALDLLPDLWEQPTFKAIKESDLSDVEKTRLAKMVIDEALASIDMSPNRKAIV